MSSNSETPPNSTSPVPPAPKPKKGNPWVIVDKLLTRVETLVVAFRILLFFYCTTTCIIVLFLSNWSVSIGFPTLIGSNILFIILTASTFQPPVLKKFHEKVKKLLKPNRQSTNQVQAETTQPNNAFDSLFTFAAVESIMSDSVAIDIDGGGFDGGDCGDGDCGDGGDGGDCGGGDGGGCD